MRGKLSGLALAIPERDWRDVKDIAGDQLSEIAYVPFRHDGNRTAYRLIVRRRILDLGPLMADSGPHYSYRFFITNRAGDAGLLEKEMRRHAEVEDPIRELKYGMGLNHFPSGRFCANAAWLWIGTQAHNLLKWLRQIGSPNQGAVTTATMRRKLIGLPGRITSSGRLNILHLARGWPWREAIAGNVNALGGRVLPA